MFPGAEIIISSLLPRKEELHNRTVTNLNDFLYGICCSTNKVRFMRNINVKRYMLVDNKQFSKEGSFRLLSNIRFTLHKYRT